MELVGTKRSEENCRLHVMAGRVFETKWSPYLCALQGGAWELSRHSPGFGEFIANLVWAQAHCDGKIHVIIAIPKDKTMIPHRIGECFPSPIEMNVTHIDRETGEFVLEAQDAANATRP
jgi:hypothetical protein